MSFWFFACIPICLVISSFMCMFMAEAIANETEKGRAIHARHRAYMLRFGTKVYFNDTSIDQAQEYRDAGLTRSAYLVDLAPILAIVGVLVGVLGTPILLLQ